LTKLIVDHNIDLKSLIYVGTESAIDSSKPIALSSSLDGTKIWRKYLASCDVVDFTFACIAGVDAKTVIYTVEPHEKKSNCCLQPILLNTI
jgi:hydroxymethylglutaryl-CoA synthase